MQSAVGHPLTVYGTGGQTRAFIHIRDTVKCIQLAVENPPQKGDRVNIFNQTTECHTIRDLAEKVSKMTGAPIRYYINPRNEDAENELRFCNEKFLKLGLNPVTLDEGLMNEVIGIAKKYKHRCDLQRVICTSRWQSGIPVDYQGSNEPRTD